MGMRARGVEMDNRAELTDSPRERLPVFVYGTLRCGEPNHRILAGSPIAIEAGVLDGADMYAAAFPYVTPGAGSVVGEVVWIDPDRYDETMARLDHLEGYRGPDRSNHYDRHTVTVTTDAGELVSVWVYFAGRLVEPDRYPLVAGGDWIAYRRSAAGSRRVVGVA